MYKILRFLDHVLNHAELYKQNKCFCDQSSFPALTCKSVRFLHSPSYLVKANNYMLLIYTMFSSLLKASPVAAAARLGLAF